MTNFAETIGYNFGTTILILIAISITFNYFYLYKRKKDMKKRIHAAQQKTSRRNITIKKLDEKLIAVTKDCKELEIDNEKFINALSDNQVEKIL